MVDLLPDFVIDILDYVLEYAMPIYEPALQVYAALWIAWIVSRYVPVQVPGVRVILEACLFNWTAVLCFPIYPTGFGIFYFSRYLTSCYLHWRYEGKVSLMPGSDAVWGTESFANACNFTSLYVLQGKPSVEKVRARILQGVIEKEVDGERIYDKLRWRAGTRLTLPVWEKMDGTFDIANHVRVLHGNLEASYSEDDVFEEISKFFDHPLPTDKPQWECYIVPKYVYNDARKVGDYYALIFRIHHSIMDGVSAGFALQNAIADSPPKLTVNPLAPLKLSTVQRVLGYLAILIFGLGEAVKSFTLLESNCFHGPKLTGPKKLGWSRPVDLEALKGMKNATRSSTTAVLMSALGSSLRSLAIKKNLKIPKHITSSLTVAILPYPDMRPQNRFTVVLFPMNLGLGTTLERIKSTYHSAQKLAKSSAALVNFYLMRLLGETSTHFCKLFNKLLHATMLLSNVPGPAERASLFGGDVLVDVAFWTPLRNSIAISMSLFSYAGQIRVAMVGDQVIFPDPTDIPTLIAEFEKEIIRTGELAGISPENCFHYSSSTDKDIQTSNS